MKKFAALLLVFLLIFSINISANNTENYIEERDITKDLLLENSARYDESTNTILLCPNRTWSNGKAKYPFEVCEDFTVSFDYMIGGGTSADGIILAFFAQKDTVVVDGGYLNFNGCGGYGLEFDTYTNTNDSKKSHIAIVRDDVSNHLFSVDEPRVDDEKWHNAVINIKGTNITVSIDGDVIIDQNINFDKTYRYMYFGAATGACTDDHYIRNVKFTGRAAYSNASNWAIEEMDKAELYNLIPDAFKGEDMTKLITRKEFAALSVKLYETLAEKQADEADEPFTDTDDSDVAKAYGLGITNGTKDNLFEPDSDISREEVATMLTRTLKAYMPDLDTTPGQNFKFADDSLISDWAKESVYFMVDKKIILGMGDNKFAPKNATLDDEAVKYANSTREQALLMSVRAYEAIK